MNVYLASVYGETRGIIFSLDLPGAQFKAKEKYGPKAGVVLLQPNVQMNSRPVRFYSRSDPAYANLCEQISKM